MMCLSRLVSSDHSILLIFCGLEEPWLASLGDCIHLDHRPSFGGLDPNDLKQYADGEYFCKLSQPTKKKILSVQDYTNPGQVSIIGLHFV